MGKVYRKEVRDDRAMTYETFKGSKYDSNLTTTEIAKLIREQLKKEFPKCKFSVRTEYFSGGSSITVSLMSAPFKVIEDFKNIPEEALLIYGKERVKELQKERYHQLSTSYFYDEYDPKEWNNGVFLTKEGFKLLKRVVEIVDQYRKTEGDLQTDYYNTNFYFHLEIGKWNKPFEDVDDKLLVVFHR